MSRTLGSALTRVWSWVRPEPDEILLERFVTQGDESAFNSIVHRHAGLVYAVARRILPLAVDAEDAVQVTFLILTQRAHVVRKRSSLKSWLHGVALRVARSMRRRQARLYHREQAAADVLMILSPAELIADTDLQELLRREVACLPERYRRPLELCYWQGQSRDQMAQTLGWSTGMVKGQLERAKRRLKARLALRGVDFILPIGIGLTALGALSVLPTVVSAAASASSATATIASALRLGSFVTHSVQLACKTFQASKGVAALAVVTATLGIYPVMDTPSPSQEAAMQPPVAPLDLDQWTVEDEWNDGCHHSDRQ